MRTRLEKIFMGITLFMGLMSTILITWYDIVRFQPRRAEIANFLATANRSDRDPPDLLTQIILVDYDHYRLAKYVARQLLFQFKDVGSDGVGWHIRYAIWIQLVRFHYSEKEMVGLFSTLAEKDRVMGLENLSRKYFEKSVYQLNEDECAMLVASMRIPFLEKDRLKKRADKLLYLLRKNKSGDVKNDR